MHKSDEPEIPTWVYLTYVGLGLTTVLAITLLILGCL